MSTERRNSSHWPRKSMPLTTTSSVSCVCIKWQLRLCSAQQLKQQMHSTVAATQWRGDTALTFWLFWRRSSASSVFRVGARRRAFALLPPPPRPPSPVPVANRPPRLCGRKAKCLLGRCESPNEIKRRSSASSVFRVGARRRAFALLPPLPAPRPPSPSLIGHLASADVKQNVY